MSVEEILLLAKPGDLVKICRGLYSHWAMFIGDGNVIHITCDPSVWTNGFKNFLQGFFKKSVVRVDNLSNVARDCLVVINNNLDSKFAHVAVENMMEKATEMLGKEGYSYLFGNCETFVNLCRYGEPVSFQAVFALELFMAMGAGFVVGAITKELLEHKIGFKWAMFAGVCTGGSTTYLVELAIHGSFVTEFLATCVTKVSELVMLNVIPVIVTNILTIGVVGLVCYGLYRVVTSETFKKLVREVAGCVVSRFGSFLESFAKMLVPGSSSSNAITK